MWGGIIVFGKLLICYCFELFSQLVLVIILYFIVFY
jgi:hypothetical protein